MTWTKFGAEFPAEARRLSSDAYRLLTESIMYSNFLHADLCLTRGEVQRGTWVTADLEPLITELLRSGWWERLPDGLFMVSARFPEWQRSSEQVEAKRRRDREAQARARERRKQPAEVSASDSSAESVSWSAQSSERNGTVEKSERSLRAVSGDWPVVHRCSVCLGVLDVSLGSTHPTCGES